MIILVITKELHLSLVVVTIQTFLVFGCLQFEDGSLLL